MQDWECRICGSKDVAYIDRTNGVAVCYECLPERAFIDGVEYQKVRKKDYKNEQG